jgi:RimJ/RimL family protein N-acetyltransferase
VPGNVTIRPALRGDLDTWFELFESVAAEGRWIGAEAPVHRRWAEPMFRDLLAAEDKALLLAELDGVVVGSLSVEDQRGCAELGMMVRDGHRRAGIGSALLGACLEWAKQQRAHKVTLSVWPHNEGAIALYRKHGFEVEGRLVRHWRRRNAELWDLIQMCLVLDTTSPGSPHPDPAV